MTGVEKVTWVMRSWRHDDKVNVDVPCRFGLQAEA